MKEWVFWNRIVGDTKITINPRLLYAKYNGGDKLNKGSFYLRRIMARGLDNFYFSSSKIVCA